MEEAEFKVRYVQFWSQRDTVDSTLLAVTGEQERDEMGHRHTLSHTVYAHSIHKFTHTHNARTHTLNSHTHAYTPLTKKYICVRDIFPNIHDSL